MAIWYKKSIEKGANSMVIEVTEQSFKQEVLESELSVLVDFSGVGHAIWSRL
jgi:thioredoxin-like negative regulator of GroEL